MEIEQQNRPQAATQPEAPATHTASHRQIIAAMLLVFALTILAYWRMPAGEFVWDDVQYHEWLRDDDAGCGQLTHAYCGLKNYFRPVAEALTLFEVRSFGVAAFPMHVVSLCMHLLNALLVGMLALSLRRRSDAREAFVFGVPMLLYALHPVLVEPVAWISAQTELAVTFFMLLGILLNARLAKPAARAAAVATCFFMAACSKESAVAFPFALVACDWFRLQAPGNPGAVQRIRALLQRQWQTYLAIVVAGIVYLAWRHAQLGYLLEIHQVSSPSLPARLQTVFFLYLVYARMLAWPMVGLGPVHDVDENGFGVLTSQSLLIDIGALGIAIFGLLGWWKRKPWGTLIVVVTALLLPVLHIVPATFDESLYHDRYAMAPLALAAALLPAGLDTLRPFSAGLTRLLIGALGLWLLLAVLNIRANLPLWSNETSLWQWALRSNPGSVSARENLFASYVMSNDPRANSFAHQLVGDPQQCISCLLNVANYALREHDEALAGNALLRLRTTTELAHDAKLQLAYFVATGDFLKMQGDLAQAEVAYRTAVDVNPREPVAQMRLATLLVRAGKLEEALRMEQSALALFAPQQREAQQREFEQALEAMPRQP